MSIQHAYKRVFAFRETFKEQNIYFVRHNLRENIKKHRKKFTIPIIIFEGLAKRYRDKKGVNNKLIDKKYAPQQNKTRCYNRQTDVAYDVSHRISRGIISINISQ